MAEAVPTSLDEQVEPSTTRRPLWRIWVAGVLAVPVVAIGPTVVFMRQPPAGGPWSRWDLFSIEDYLGWMLTVLLTWTLIVACIAAARHRSDGLRLPLLFCVIPALLLVSLVGWVRKPSCPSQFPRGDMLEPLPSGVQVLERSRSDVGVTSYRSVVIAETGEVAHGLDERSTSHYLDQGWNRHSSSSAGLLVAGDWELSIRPWWSDRDPLDDQPVGAELQMIQSDAGCGPLS